MNKLQVSDLILDAVAELIAENKQLQVTGIYLEDARLDIEGNKRIWTMPVVVKYTEDGES